MPAQQPQQNSGGGRGGGGGRGKHKSNGGKTGPLLDSLKEACPPHKLGDLEALVKSLKGDEAKIRQKIAEWWEEGAAPPEEWNDVSKNKSTKPKPNTMRGGGRGGRGGGRGGRGDRKQRTFEKKKATVAAPAPTPTPAAAIVEPTAAQSVAAALPKSPEPDPVPQPTPSPAVPSPQVGKGASTTPQRNVWTTKGSAHLIRAEKPVEQPPKPVVVEETPPEVSAVVAPPPPPPMIAEPPAPAVVKVTKTIETPPAWEEPAPVRKPAVSVNMGRWDMKDTAEHDFEFGSFQEEPPLEPARPPPGLSMPPMPSNAVLVHELENKLDQVTVTETQAPPVVPTHAEMVSQYPNTTRSATAAPYGAPYNANGYNNNNTSSNNNNAATSTGFSAPKPYNGAPSSGSAPSEVLPVPQQNHYGGPMYYQPHQMHLAGQHQPPYNFSGYTQLGYAFPPNYNYNGAGGAAGGGGQEDSKNNRNRNNQNYQQYAPTTPYMSNHGYDPRYEHGYVPQQQGSHQQQQSSYTFDNDYSKKNKGRSNNLHSQFQGGPPNFLQQQQQHQQEHPQHPQQHQPEWNSGWNANTWQNGGGK